tara:strand:- start:6531 stop:6797 length:267 start_codon:yes stop_codon:yes gene_type:complete
MIDLNNVDTAAQRSRVIHALRENPKGLSTIQLREEWNVMAPAPRVFELRHDHGFNIEKVYTTSTDSQGHEHRNARYILKPSSSNGVEV